MVCVFGAVFFLGLLGHLAGRGLVGFMPPPLENYVIMAFAASGIAKSTYEVATQKNLYS